MAIRKNDFPILEFDTSKKAIIEPNRNGKNNFPKYCVMTFFNEVLNNYLKKSKNSIIGEYRSEMKVFPVYGLAPNRYTKLSSYVV